ncbi:MAG TPA: hypothetical protein VGP48_10355 [Stellaceae bacterium]|jgi:hypothetical protein|nr:hypothetical protein [Stellaceae bacterium]
MDTDQSAELRHDLARYRNLLAMNSDERVRAVLQALITEAECRMRQALEDKKRLAS